MKSLLFRVILVSLPLAFGTTLRAQTFNASYSYDANGNRESATIIFLSMSGTSPGPTIKDELKVDLTTNLKITIYPNPTQGNLRMELTGAISEQLNVPGNAIRVWDMQGRLLLSVNSLGASNSVDLSGFSNGTYIMQLFFNGKVRDYKIVKN